MAVTLTLACGQAIRTPQGTLLLSPHHKGQLFVKGIWIADMSGDNGDSAVLSTGVDFYRLDLDRDRRAVVRTSDLDHQVSTMWTQALEARPDLIPRYYEVRFAMPPNLISLNMSVA